MGGKSTNTTLDDGKVQLTPSHLLDVIDEEWLEDSLPFDDVDVPANMRLSSSAYEMDYALLSGVSGAQGGGSGSGRGEAREDEGGETRRDEAEQGEQPQPPPLP